MYWHNHISDLAVLQIIDSILEPLRPLPLVHVPKGEEKKKKPTGSGGSKPTVPATTRTVVLADGTYGTETISEAQQQQEADAKESQKSVFKKLISLGDYLLAACLGVALTKLALKLPAGANPALKNEVGRV